ncbi:MAG: carbohydrate binding family 9 domain-containing protein [Candidatus Aminicenantes bacterium]|nr:carbohydrate binding family 9 domain-containing protein [Candidatus Aminicenantes bacterium]
MKRALFTLLMALLGMMALAVDGKKVYTCRHINPHSPAIDGRGDDPCWEKVPWGGGFVQDDPCCGEAPTEATEFKVMYDDKNLYLLVRCHDGQAATIDRRISRRDEIDGDYLAVYIDSYHDRRTAFGFKVNAAGVKADVALSGDSNNPDPTWDPLWAAKAAVDAGGWTAEMAIPFSQLRFASGKAVFGLQVRRMLYRKQEISSWAHIPKQAPGFVSLFGELQGLEGIRAQHQVEIVPYAVAQETLAPREQGNPFADGSAARLIGGIDGKIGLTSDLTLDFTLNPDFGQVEADPSVVNLTAYETYFQEKRPFFTEGRSILDFQIMGGDGDFSRDNLFYSRRIGRAPRYSPDLQDDEFLAMPTATSILGAFKVTGKTRRGLSLGVMDNLTARERATIGFAGGSRLETVEPLANYFMLSAKQDLRQGQTTVGAMVTAVNRDIRDGALDFLHRSAYSGGLDLYHSWKSRRYYLWANAVFSLVQGSQEALQNTQTSAVHYFQRPDADYLNYDPGRTSMFGHGGTVTVGRSGGSPLRYSAGVTWRSPGLELNDMGYLSKADAIMTWGWAGYRISKPTWIFNSLNMNFNAWAGYDFGLEPIFAGGNVNFWGQLRNYWSLNAGINRQGNGLSLGSLRGGPALRSDGGWSTWFGVGSDSRRRFTAEASGYCFAAGNGTRGEWGGDLSLACRPGTGLVLTVAPGYSRYQNELLYVATPTAGVEDRYVMGHIVQDTFYVTLRLNFSITPDLSIQFYGQPFIANGRYDEFKRITDSRARLFQDRFHAYAPEEIAFDAAAEEYAVHEASGAGYSFANPDFNVLELRSNLVVRWEYRPGAALYLVWSQGRGTNTGRSEFDLGSGFRDLMNLPATHVFLLKFTYNFNL